MYCKNCGNKLEEGARFCNNCGTPVEMNTPNINEINTNTNTNINTNTNPNMNINPNVSTNKDKKKSTIWIIGIIGFMVIVLGVIMIKGKSSPTIHLKPLNNNTQDEQVGELYYNLPDGFELSDTAMDNLKIYRYSDEEDTSCNVTFMQLYYLDNQTVDELLLEDSNYYASNGEKIELKDIKIGGKKWRMYETSSTYWSYKIYGFINDSKEYYYNIQLADYSLGEKHCDAYWKEILESISIK